MTQRPNDLVWSRLFWPCHCHAGIATPLFSPHRTHTDAAQAKAILNSRKGPRLLVQPSSVPSTHHSSFEVWIELGDPMTALRLPSRAQAPVRASIDCFLSRVSLLPVASTKEGSVLLDLRLFHAFVFVHNVVPAVNLAHGSNSSLFVE